MSEIFGEAFISICILTCGILIPSVILLLSWSENPFRQLPLILSVANGHNKIHDVLLIVVPLGTISVLTGFVFGFRGHRMLWRGVFIPCMFIPVLALLTSQIFLYFFLFGSAESLDDNSYFVMSISTYVSLSCIVLIELYMSVSRSVANWQGT
jgi:uncharacterized membrane protein